MALSSGVYSLIGVVVGGGITGGVQWATAARADWLDARVARRRVEYELQAIRTGIAPLVGDTETALQNREGLDLVLNQEPQFVAHGDRLARQLSDPDWQAVTTAYREAKFLLVVDDASEFPEAARTALAAVDAALASLG